MMRRDLPVLEGEILVIGSGAGGAVTAATLAETGHDVLVLEEGPVVGREGARTNSPEAMQSLYRQAGMSPLLGPHPIAFVEGRCVGGSTEINAGFWSHLPREVARRWQVQNGIREFDPTFLDQLREEIEKVVEPCKLESGDPAPSSRLFRQGLDGVGASYGEVPRVCASRANPFEPGAKRSMSRTFLPRAVAAGARLRAGARAIRLLHHAGRVSMVLAEIREGDVAYRVKVVPEHVFLCAGAIQTPALLRRSGIRRAVGASLYTHPMLKIAAEFEQAVDADQGSLPIYQLRADGGELVCGGSAFSPGLLAMTLAESGCLGGELMDRWRRMALYYVSCRGTGRGRVWAVPYTGEALATYRCSAADHRRLLGGLDQLCRVLFAAGARRLFAAVDGSAPLESATQIPALLDLASRDRRMSLSAVHVFGSCPMGEQPERCPTDSFGRLRGFQNLWVSDASILPDAPGVNPQSVVMTLALRNARRFAAGGGLHGSR